MKLFTKLFGRSFFCPVIINKIMALYRNIFLYYCVRSKKLSGIVAAGSGGGEWSKAISGSSPAVSVGQILHFGYYSVQRLLLFFCSCLFFQSYWEFWKVFNSLGASAHNCTLNWQELQHFSGWKWYNKKFYLRWLTFMLVDITIWNYFYIWFSYHISFSCGKDASCWFCSLLQFLVSWLFEPNRCLGTVTILMWSKTETSD